MDLQIIFIKYFNYWGTIRDEPHLSGYYCIKV